jgi:3-oxoacyl-[acyl-carrier protein] reductase
MDRKSIWITGAGKGIGQALVAHFHALSFKILATDVDEEALHALQSHYPSIRAEKQNVTNFATWEALCAQFEAEELPYYLINNAGICLPAYAQEETQAIVDATIDINTKGLMYGTQVFAKHCVKRGYGHIINICSLAGITPTPGLASYCASKFAARGYTLSVAMDLRDKGIQVSAICPDGVATPMIDGMAKFEASAMAFSGSKLLQTKDIVKAVEKAMRTKKPEIALPATRALTARLAGLHLPLVWGIKGLLERKGAKARAKFLQEKNKN